MSRIIIYGAGAVGGAIGGECARAGHEVLLVARGAHKAVIESRGLSYVTPTTRLTLEVPVVERVDEIAFREDDLVITCMKTQDTAAALGALASTAPRDLPIVCAQNGVASEDIALRRFPNVYGMASIILSSYLEPGEVVLHAAPIPGVFHLGRYPHGLDAVGEHLADALRAAGFHTHLHDDVRPFKYAKLLGNLVNAAQAVLEPDAVSTVTARAREEGHSVLAAAGISWTPEEEFQRYQAPFTMANVPGRRRFGGSTWQSLARGTGSVEADYLAGEIVLLGRKHDVPAPVNALLQHLANEASRTGLQPGYLPGDEFDALLAAVERAEEPVSGSSSRRSPP